MAKVKLTIELDYDADSMHGNEPKSRLWFFNTILSGDTGELLLHSNEIGDTIGAVRVLSVDGKKV